MPSTPGMIIRVTEPEAIQRNVTSVARRLHHNNVIATSPRFLPGKFRIRREVDSHSVVAWSCRTRMALSEAHQSAGQLGISVIDRTAAIRAQLTRKFEYWR
jgi:hypothetical protein